MPRGGKREGAGRKPDIEFWLSIRIGAKIERQIARAQAKKDNARREASRDRIIDDWASPGERAAEWARKHGISLTARDDRGQLVYRKAWRESPTDHDPDLTAGEQHEIDVAETLREIQSIPEDDLTEPTRLRQVSVKRVKGPAVEIYRKVAARCGISERAARRCHEAFREFAAQAVDL